MIHATIQYTQTDKSRPVIVSICLKIHGSIFVSPSRLPQYVTRAWLLSHNLTKEMAKEATRRWGGSGGKGMKKLLEISTWYSFPEIPGIFTPSRQLILGKGRTSSKKKTMT